MEKTTKKTARWAVTVLVVVLAVLLVNGSMVVTRSNEYSVIRQFGRVVSIRSRPGISFMVPVIQTVDKMPNTVLLYDLPVSDVCLLYTSGSDPRISALTKEKWARSPLIC